MPWKRQSVQNLRLKLDETALGYYPQMQRVQKRIEALLDEKSPQAL
ncbi:hypothetical protein predicted by Glimmer/Critica [Bartonella tribocorum CIP 105476]|uniref:Uncharacterized protein n=1 Tax=Bartonella tribocorum (strain DSM 28219 / CCUG 45778 / CIP 105476 / IBS 506) TaxID=382640 RepID=A9IXS3_BART1|nr:hypothetical protein predicted by Glimmer/Critica [Bartonella tribocorum CIP 105476]